MYTPGARQVQKRFDVSLPAAILPLTIYVLGLGFGPVISAPLSETFGRKMVYLSGFPPFLLFTLGAGFAQNFGTLLVCRFFAGFLGSGSLAVGAGTNSDLWPPIARAAAASTFISAPFLGPALGPAIGGFAAMNNNWRWTQWTILFIGVPFYLAALFQSETYKKIILMKRAKRLDIPPPPNPLPQGLARVKFLLVVTLFRPIRMLVTEPIVAYFSLYTAFNFSVLFAFFAAFPLVFQGVYHRNLGEGGLAFLGIGIGVISATLIFILIDRLTYQKWTIAARARGDMSPLAPEHRLYAAMLGSFLLPVSLFWFGWTARKDVHWASPLIATIPFGAGNMLVFCSATLYLVDTYGPLGGASALAGNGLLRYSAGACFPLFVTQMYEKLGVDWATSLFCFVTIGLLPIPWILFKFGPKIRARSAYETTKA